MTLLICTIAAITTAIMWYIKPDSKLKIGFLPIMYFSASLMWFVDAIFEYNEQGVSYFNQDANTLLNDSILGVCVFVLGLLIWMVYLFIKDPNEVIKKKFN